MTVHQQVEQLYEEERDAIYAYLLHFGVTAARAQEMTQESFLKLYLKMEKGESIDNPRAWLFRVAHHFAIKQATREPRFDPLLPHAEPPQAQPDPEQQLIRQEQHLALLRAVQDLSPQQRNCLHLRVQGLQYREIADVIGISTSAVGEFLRRATKRLKEAVHG